MWLRRVYRSPGQRTFLLSDSVQANGLQVPTLGGAPSLALCVFVSWPTSCCLCVHRGRWLSPCPSLDSSRELFTASTHPSLGPARPELRREIVYYFLGRGCTQTIGSLGQILLDTLQDFLGTYVVLNTVLFLASLSPWAEMWEQGGLGGTMVKILHGKVWEGQS